MGRADFGRACNRKPESAPTCSVCEKDLPRSAFPKAELNRGGSRRCRNCGQQKQCRRCNEWFLASQLDERSHCRKCGENAQVDRFLQTPKDEVTQFGVEIALQIDRESEYQLLLAGYRCGLHERMVLQRILDFLRVPFVTTQNSMHFCELCDETFQELAVKQGQLVQIATLNRKIDWLGCPEPHLKFNSNETYTVAELLKAPNDRWFFRTLVKPVKSQNEEEAILSRGCFNPPDRSAVKTVINDVCNNIAANNSSDLRAVPEFQSFWAPLDLTVEGQQPSPSVVHLNSTTHKAHEAEVADGAKALVSRAAIRLAKKLDEEPSLTLSRFRSGLGLTKRFCEPKHLQLAEKLERVRDVGIPVKFLREILPHRQDFLWITADEFWEAQEKYEMRRKKSSRK
eukprot:gnl/MRDRNA2_/MRDRNA2_108964_c0_seq1.p1 gnl/MRDRNA2_/MRDRNA2_108964_c0~~gnl/MRDRNA2_/MRDRNA2_108964_c0_seq1.p1  ORF type:complete len:398 (+),score=60.35 gnl/MRDRNA2_/MRDRNA2_108964_c0_seq1:94-1287(+)